MFMRECQAEEERLKSNKTRAARKSPPHLLYTFTTRFVYNIYIYIPLCCVNAESSLATAVHPVTCVPQLKPPPITCVPVHGVTRV